MATPPLPVPADLDGVLLQHRHDPTRLLQILIDAQDLAGWLPAPTLTHIAAALGIPRARVEGVAGFYSFLYTRPVGRYRVLFSDNITDRMLGNDGLLDALCRKLWVEPGHVSEDGLVSVATTSCTGLCDQGPAMLVNGRAIGQLNHPAHQRDRRTHPPAKAARSMAGGLLPHRRQRPPP